MPPSGCRAGHTRYLYCGYNLYGETMKAIITTLITVLALSLAGCSSPAPSQDGPTGDSASVSATPSVTVIPTALPAGKFKLVTKSGAEITFTLPTPTTDPAVADIEAFRTETGGAPVSYLVADVDNRKGTERVNMYRVFAFDAEGRQYTFTTVTDALDAWKPTYRNDYEYKLPNGTVIDQAMGSALNRRATELYNANIDDADVSERTRIILASTDAELPTEFTRVAVLPSGGMGKEEEARPAS